MFSVRSPIFACLALVAAASLGVACGGGDDGGQPNGASTTGDAPGDGEVFDVVMDDNLFDPDELTVPLGASVTFNLTNEGAAVHNMRIAGPDGDYRSDDDAVSDPDLSRSGETATLVWTAPDEAGEIDFRCDFHPDIMVGTITVQ